MLRFLLRSAIWAIDAGLNTPQRKGARGERKVHNALTEVIAGPDYKVFSDLILPTARETTQIDHLIISRFGIFVIETKNMSGWIFGSADQRNPKASDASGHYTPFIEGGVYVRWMSSGQASSTVQLRLS